MNDIRALLESLDNDLARATDAQFSRSLMRGRVKAILAALEGEARP